MRYAPRVSQLRHCGRVRTQKKRLGWRRSQTSSAPVRARKTRAASSADIAGPGAPEASADIAGTRKQPAASDLVQR